MDCCSSVEYSVTVCASDALFMRVARETCPGSGPGAGRELSSGGDNAACGSVERGAEKRHRNGPSPWPGIREGDALSCLKLSAPEQPSPGQDRRGPQSAGFGRGRWGPAGVLVALCASWGELVLEALDPRPKKRKKVVKRTQAGAVELQECYKCSLQSLVESGGDGGGPVLVRGVRLDWQSVSRGLRHANLPLSCAFCGRSPPRHLVAVAAACRPTRKAPSVLRRCHLTQIAHVSFSTDCR